MPPEVRVIGIEGMPEFKQGDDLAGLRGKRKGKGMMARYKFLWQLIIALGTSIVLFFVFDIRSVALPFNPNRIDMGLSYIPIATFIIVASTNAVNITDGLDGLAGLISGLGFSGLLGSRRIRRERELSLVGQSAK